MPRLVMGSERESATKLMEDKRTSARVGGSGREREREQVKRRSENSRANDAKIDTGLLGNTRGI
jgi:hypothetical protein